MVAGRILFDLCDAILHVGDADFRRGRLFANEFPQILQLGSQARARAVVEQDEQFEAGMLSLSWNPVGNRVANLALQHHHIFALNDWYVLSMMRLNRHHHVRWNSARSLLGREPGHAVTTNRQTQSRNSQKSVFVHNRSFQKPCNMLFHDEGRSPETSRGWALSRPAKNVGNIAPARAPNLHML